MAGNKKKKKPATNPARGFATTSVASKPRPEATETDLKPGKAAGVTPFEKSEGSQATDGGDRKHGSQDGANEQPLSAEEFEQQLEESELQLLVEKLTQKCKRDAGRQRNRLETDRRLLRGQAEPINSIKWLPPELMEHILDLIKAESRFSVSSLSTESQQGPGKMPPEEDMVARLWTLQQLLLSADFLEYRVQGAIKHILGIASSIATSGKDLLWGLDESLDWLARECDIKELPPYELKPKPASRGISLHSI
jgi:ATP-dependent RNA helicase DHX29